MPALPALVLAVASVLPAQVDQVSPTTNAWFYTKPGNVWQQQVRAGVDGVLDAFEVHVKGPVGAQVELRLRLGDGWSVGPVEWSQLHVKAAPGTQAVVFDVSAAGLQLAAGDTFVIEAEGNGTLAELVGSYLHPDLGPPGYPEPLLLDGPGTYLDGGWRIGFRTWMRPVPSGAPGGAIRHMDPVAVLPGLRGSPTPLVLPLPGVSPPASR